MLIEITEEHLAQLKRELQCLKNAQEMAEDKDVIPDDGYQIFLQNLLSGGIVILQQIIETVEQRPIG